MKEQRLRCVKVTVLMSLFCLLLQGGCDKEGGLKVTIEDGTQTPQASFAIAEIQAALQAADFKVVDQGGSVTIRLAIDADAVEPQGYRIESKDDCVNIIGGDARGVMYGGLEVAERIALDKGLPDQAIEGKPFLEKRGIKMNIPLDARTPSYDDSGCAAMRNTPEIWEWSFWETYLDTLARNRYNSLTLWNPHPFPSMIKLEKYPDVALDDVCVTTLVPEGLENEWGEPQLVSSNVVENLKVVKRITIEEKITLWQKIMRYAKDRGIDIFFITWNICPNSVAKPVAPFYRTYSQPIWDEVPGKYGVTHQINNPATVAYLREAVKTFVLTYPDLKGIGVTAGEHMPHKQKEFSIEQWLWDTYGQGILDAKQEQPDRKVHFIHRIWNTRIENITDIWDAYPDSLDFSFKYAKARLYSTPKPPFADRQIEIAKKTGTKFWWNLRNDDIFVHRWGDPDYVRAFLTNFNMEYTRGYHMGSDGYVWGREFISKHPSSPREMEMDKHWYRFMMWGRLGYDPQLDEAFFVRKLAQKFPKTDAQALYATWQAASRIIPQVNRFHWRDWDHMWSVEACLAHLGGFREVFDFVDNPTLQGSGILNPKQYVTAQVASKTITGITPLDVVAQLEQDAEAAIKGADALAKTKQDVLKQTLADIRSMSWLGRYYAAKIRAAVEIAWFQETAEQKHKEEAIAHMDKALEAWLKYAEICEMHYHSQHLARTKELDWSKLSNEVKRECQMVLDLK